MSRLTDRPPDVRLDHLVLAVPELETAVAEIRREWGCAVHPGGRHPRWGSWNAVVPLEGGAYLEIIAPHPDPPEVGRRVFGLDHVTEPVLATWAVRPVGAGPGGEVEALAGALRDAGVDPGPLQSGSRRTPDGRLLTWRLTDPFAGRLDGTVPFLIDWGGTPHPSGVGEAEAALASLAVGHPEGPRLSGALAALGAGGVCRVVASKAPLLRATLSVPGGAVTLAGPVRGAWGVSSWPP